MNQEQELRLKYIKKVLSDIISVPELNQDLIFKWGTSLMLFHDLDRFSEDLDFNFINEKAFIHIEYCLNNKWYKYQKQETSFWRMYTITYKENNINYNCIIDLAWYNYNTQPKYNVKNFNGIPLKVLTLEHNFAHKLCAFYERKKWRDVIDIDFYLWKWIMPNSDILKERHNRTFSQFWGIVLKELQTPYLQTRLSKALDQLHYNSISIAEFKDQLIDNINSNYDWNKISPNLYFKDQLKKWDKIIQLNDDQLLFVDWKVMNSKITSKFAVVNKSDSKIVYQAQTEEKINKYFNEVIIDWNMKLKIRPKIKSNFNIV